uniref:Ig-like domain-containing protein n=1 Tax=Cyprinus carpio TaxID=7962 RepID=A0A8C1TC74_CYPCA
MSHYPRHDFNYFYFFPGVFSVITARVTVTVSVSVMKGDSVTLYTKVTTTQQEEILWYFNDTRIAAIAGDLSRICTDVQCNEDTERFRDRLNLKNQTGSLTIKNIQTADTGVYQLKIFSSSSIREKTFSVTVIDAPDKVKTISVKKGESVTFDPGVIKTTNYVMRWYFNETLIAEITGDQSKICTDDQCKERFRDRLKLNNQTGSLTITDTRTTDSGDYKVLIVSHFLQHSITSLKTFIFTVIDSGLSSAAVAGICVAVVLLFVAAAAAGVIYYRKRPQAGQNSEYGQR